ncbi:cysteine desulfurase family protein [Aquimarina agarilytica]|uniref:cysteine desulfurase family protein n=1 Tax=Aquimarina agarilytica TaxID=1087449 RepID=UPI000287A93E|nr:cysteine desulfurase family protein [Aquimarina agarilytica]
MKTVYLDNAATTPMRPEVIDRMYTSMQQIYANPSATYGIGRTSKANLEAARKKIASLVHADASEIIFTSGGTEANNLIINSAVRDLGVTHIITSKIEHHAVLKAVKALEIAYPIKVSYVSLLPEGDIDIDSLTTILANSKDKILVSLMHINNEIGSILDVNVVGELCVKYNALFHTDMVQSIGHYKIDFLNTPINFATASAHKFYGPKGIGFAVIQKNSGIKALQYGGEQERGIRAGTESIHQIEGMAVALELACTHMEIETKAILKIKQYAIAQLNNKFKAIGFNANSDKLYRNYNLLNVCLPISHEKASTTLFKLDMLGVCCSRGSACQSGSNKPSHVLAEILSEDQLTQTSLRFSFSIYTSTNDIDTLVDALDTILTK